MPGDYAEMHKTIVREDILEYITKTKGSVPEKLAYLLYEAVLFGDDDMERYLRHQMRLLTSVEAERTKDLIESMKASNVERDREVDVYDSKPGRYDDDRDLEDEDVEPKRKSKIREKFDEYRERSPL